MASYRTSSLKVTISIALTPQDLIKAAVVGGHDLPPLQPHEFMVALFEEPDFANTIIANAERGITALLNKVSDEIFYPPPPTLDTWVFPLVLPRSEIRCPPFVVLISACRRETFPSSSVRSRL